MVPAICQFRYAKRPRVRPGRRYNRAAWMLETMLPTETRRIAARGSDSDLPSPRPADQTDAAVLAGLLERVARGDHEALGALYDSTVGKLFALARLMLRNDADAEEVVCDVYTQVWQSAGGYRSERGGVMAWLLMICRSRSLDLMRRNKVRAPSTAVETGDQENLAGSAPGPEDILQLMQQGTLVHDALRKLTPVRLRLVSLAFFRGMSHFEIAEECKLPVGTVKSHIRRALVTLREELEGGERYAAPTA